MPTVVRPKHRKSAPAPAPVTARRGKAKPKPKQAPKKTPPALVREAAENPATWADLTGNAGEARARRVRKKKERAISTRRYGLVIILLAVVGTLYIGHQYESQKLVEEVQQLRGERTRLVLQKNRLKGEFDEMTAPSVILRRAEALGLQSGGHYAPPIIVDR